MRSLKDKIIAVFSNSRHNWLWDYKSTAMVLRKSGFKNIRPCKFNDSEIDAFKLVENIERFNGALAIEARK
jgi:hypothetical protein